MYLWSINLPMVNKVCHIQCWLPLNIYNDLAQCTWRDYCLNRFPNNGIKCKYINMLEFSWTPCQNSNVHSSRDKWMPTALPSAGLICPTAAVREILSEKSRLAVTSFRRGPRQVTPEDPGGPGQNWEHHRALHPEYLCFPGCNKQISHISLTSVARFLLAL